MCGITGLIQFRAPFDKTHVLERMSDAIRHRGPDDLGYLTWSFGKKIQRSKQLKALSPGHVTLMHRRLSVLDLSPLGWQPMTTADGRYSIVFNGEIYNYLELGHQLKELSYQPVSHSDTEILLQTCVQWGTAALPKLVGMFAFALLDTYERKLLLARDPFGIKPLYYRHCDRTFAFASEIGALLQIPGVNRRVSPTALYHYLHNGQTDHAQETFFAEIQQVPPAHYLEIDLEAPQALTLKPYWALDLNQQLDLSFEEARDRLRQSFLDNLKLHLRSDVPVGAALSGGIDSSAIVMGMRQVKPHNLDLHTFSYIANQSELSEEHWVDQVGLAAQSLGHKVSPSPHELTQDLTTLIKRQGEPFRSTSIYAQYRIFQLAKETGIKVMLDGQGADEMLGGYRPYLGARLASLLRQGQYQKALDFGRRASTLPQVSWPFLLLRAGGLLIPGPMQNIARQWVGQQRFLPWLQPDWVKQNDLWPLGLRLNQQPEILQEQLYRATTQVSLPQLLRYEDRNSMAHSIESRVPFLTPDLATFIFSLPEEFMIGPEGTSKRIFRAAMRGIVPDEVLNRQDKIGFATPEKNWVIEQSNWFRQILTSETAHRIPVWNLGRIHQEFESIVKGQQSFDFRVWRWVNFIQWVDCFDVTFEN